ncbi:MAG: ribose 5-phosphate isomerase B [Acholeplasmataceae bacterium]
MIIAIGNDHAGIRMKQSIQKYLVSVGHQVVNVGTDDDHSVDYPDFAKAVSNEVLKQADFGILICGTGIGMSIAANKINGIRAALIYDHQTAVLAKQHNNANVIAFGARTQTEEQAIALVKAYVDSSFETRHQTRIDKITKSEDR